LGVRSAVEGRRYHCSGCNPCRCEELAAT
jgi:hypothetical protein